MILLFSSFVDVVISLIGTFALVFGLAVRNVVTRAVISLFSLGLLIVRLFSLEVCGL